MDAVPMVGCSIAVVLGRQPALPSIKASSFEENTWLMSRMMMNSSPRRPMPWISSVRQRMAMRGGGLICAGFQFDHLVDAVGNAADDGGLAIQLQFHDNDAGVDGVRRGGQPEFQPEIHHGMALPRTLTTPRIYSGAVGTRVIWVRSSTSRTWRR